ncbi:jg11224 [Pararge aegeria aegeria]|uniref:Jg11224 protein n=1 Tax=Pararge aegeria aegeria TaxID=348720 RepID=A0A8S4RHR7_9NEOP|nr:jg11224 [Pararge aegeria aegeria]
MGKSTQVDGDNNPTSESDPAKMLEAALLQMDGIIAVTDQKENLPYLEADLMFTLPRYRKCHYYKQKSSDNNVYTEDDDIPSF